MAWVALVAAAETSALRLARISETRPQQACIATREPVPPPKSLVANHVCADRDSAISDIEFANTATQPGESAPIATKF